MYTIADEILIFQQEHTYQETVQEAMRQVAFEDVLSSVNSGMYSSLWTFSDKSRLYLEEDIFYRVNDDINYGANND